MRRAALASSVAMLVSMPALADHIIASSKSEGVVVIAKGASESNWCAEKMSLAFKALQEGGQPSKEALLRLLPKLSGLFDVQCAIAKTVKVEVLNASGAAVISGAANKGDNWSFIENKPPAPAVAKTTAPSVESAAQPAVAAPVNTNAPVSAAKPDASTAPAPSDARPVDTADKSNTMARPTEAPVKSADPAPDMKKEETAQTQAPVLKHPAFEWLNLLAFVASKNGKIDGKLSATDAYYALYAHLASGKSRRDLDRILKDEFAVKDFIAEAKPRADEYLKSKRVYRSKTRLYLGEYNGGTNSFPLMSSYGTLFKSGTGHNVAHSLILWDINSRITEITAYRLNLYFSNADHANRLFADEASARRIVAAAGNGREIVANITYEPAEVNDEGVVAEIVRIEFLDKGSNVIAVIDERRIAEGKRLAEQQRAEQAKKEFQDKSSFTESAFKALYMAVMLAGIGVIVYRTQIAPMLRADNTRRFYNLFFRRMLAVIVDAVIVIALSLPVTIVFFLLGAAIEWLTSSKTGAEGIFAISAFVITSFTYGAWFDASVYRGTLGKRLFRLVVVGNDGAEASFTTAMIRNVMKSLISLPVWPINLFLIWNEKRTLHDWIAGCVVRHLPKGITGRLNPRRIIAGHPLTFTDHETAGAYGENLLSRELELLLSERLVSAHGSTGNLVCNGRNFQVDSYVLVQGIGILLIEAKFYSGEIHVSDSPFWDIYQRGANSPKENPCIQLARTSEILADLLRRSELLRWPVVPIVVLVHPNAAIVRSAPSPRYPVVDLYELEGWIRGVKLDKSIKFSGKDSSAILLALREHEAAYNKNGKED